MSDADDIRQAVARAREAFEALDRTIAELERLVRLVDENVMYRCPAAMCTLEHRGRMPICGSSFCPGRGLPRCGNCGGKGDAHEPWCGRDEGDCP